jgi:hypothetical protein
VRGGLIFVEKTLSKELELEGYAREVIRRVQQLRKDSLLCKKDQVNLVIASELDISSLSKIIADKVGALSIEFYKLPHEQKNFTFISNETIKNKHFLLMLNKV